MSALPQKRTSRHTVGMSAMCHKRTCRPLRFWVDLLLNDYRQCERERRVAAKLRLDPDLTAVHLDDARRYRGPQAGPALLARDCIVGTAEMPGPRYGMRPIPPCTRRSARCRSHRNICTAGISLTSKF